MNTLCSEDKIPATAVDQLRRLCTLLSNSLVSLRGVILHGSAASSGFEPTRSDLDVIAIVDNSLDNQQLLQVGTGILQISGAPHPLEFSIVSLDALTNWRHPCPHLMHFGEEMRSRFEKRLFKPESHTDEDLAMHMVVARSRGIDLLGNFPVSQLPEVPRSDFLAAVLSDFEWAQNQDKDLSDYILSNACRTLAFLRDGLVLSKSEGRQWCKERGIEEAKLVAEVTRELQQMGSD
ncbi:MAG: aminoglycoside adenylyltransferase domain-containing protein [Pseudomonadota bacterium]